MLASFDKADKKEPKPDQSTPKVKDDSSDDEDATTIDMSRYG
jgi:hypothetical protein